MNVYSSLCRTQYHDITDTRLLPITTTNSWPRFY